MAKNLIYPSKSSPVPWGYWLLEVWISRTLTTTLGKAHHDVSTTSTHNWRIIMSCNISLIKRLNPSKMNVEYNQWLFFLPMFKSHHRLIHLPSTFNWCLAMENRKPTRFFYRRYIDSNWLDIPNASIQASQNQLDSQSPPQAVCLPDSLS